MYNPEKPYNELPLLPLHKELETKAILKQAISSNKILAELKGRADEIPNQSMLVNAITLQEAKDSSEIENIVTTQDTLYKAFSSNISETDAQTKEVLRYRQALWEGFNELKNRPLATNSFIKIVQTIKENSSGIRNAPGTVITSNNKTIYTPPEGENTIRNLLKNLEDFMHADDDLDYLVKLAIIHYQFEAIHPFFDGNGRTGRVLNILYIVEKGLLESPILYLSKYIIENKNDYYKNLRNVTENAAWEAWILFMLKGVEETARYTLNKINKINTLMHTTISFAKENLPTRVYSKELIELLFEQPYCKVKYIVDKGIAKRQTAAEYLNELEKIGILKSQKVGVENLYLNVKLFELLKN
ncbi:Fic family protein [Aequorivita lipolytica]|jgi:Fic family protein|uniref:Fic family protein n=1 Tax=Aequorivita lipolytica TaxID=153267 RepID=A0A5C6YPR9_9FLAO|nr:Fic/DOC family N-terminal domain-containing protein [Aequorivita lipolytica]TXD69341.1 Fic family protein [Aequorivita lipolytica]SRX50034.1 Adenosine monophosphate-protein transferase SoFic [Aequorivita lipolytica]